MKPNSELFIVLSNLCNFKCSHCVTSSSSAPENRFLISRQELSDLIKYIKAEPCIKRVHFSGGEPTLHLDIIKEIQSKLPELSYAMTSNGWYGNRFDHIFENIKLDLLFLSYDRFHKPFIDPDILNISLRASLAKGIRTYVKFTVSDATDFELLPEIKIDGVNVILNSLVATGRALEENLRINTPAVDTFWDSSCPSLREERVDNLERIIFYPGKGLTPCCGPLADSKSNNQSFIFSSLKTDYFEGNNFYKKLKSGPFNLQKNNSSIHHTSKVTSACGACEQIYGGINNPKLPIDAILATQKTPTHLPISVPLSKAEETKLSTQFKLAYIFQRMHNVKHEPLLDFEHLNSNLTSAEIHFKEIDQSNLESGLKLFLDTFESKNPDKLSKVELQSIKSKLCDFLIKSNSSMLYYYNNKAIAIIGLWNDIEHPLLKSKVNHIGVVGYDRTQISKLQAQLIKRHWEGIITKNELISIKNGDLSTSSTARIDLFNLPSQSFFKKLGFKLTALELVPL